MPSFINDTEPHHGKEFPVSAERPLHEKLKRGLGAFKLVASILQFLDIVKDFHSHRVFAVQVDVEFFRLCQNI